LTKISVLVIIISSADISVGDISEADVMFPDKESIALTEAVYYILLSLFEPLHGYGIMQQVELLSAGRVRLAAGTLYGAISTLLERGWIRSLPGETNSRKKEYVITERGRLVVADELGRLRELLDNGEKITGGRKS
jgi:DNA-binding PadR family transcriptional regulator